MNGFIALYTVVLRDLQGREYEYDQRATYAAEDKYNAGGAAELNPGATGLA